MRNIPAILAMIIGCTMEGTTLVSDLLILLTVVILFGITFLLHRRKAH